VSIDVRLVQTRADRRRFVNLPFQLFGRDPAWVPPLRLTVNDRLSPKHPANKHQDTALWLAFDDGRVVGRIGACVDHDFNALGDPWAWVGWFEAVDDPAVARALFGATDAWAGAHSMTKAVGPASFTTNDEVGLLVEGFGEAPMILTPHNPPYYEALWSDNGWRPTMDLWAWRIDRAHLRGLSPQHKRVVDLLQRRLGIRVRSVDMRNFKAEVGTLFELYNAAWRDNWGFAPLTHEELMHTTSELRRLVNPDLVLFAEDQHGDVLAGALMLPDPNEAIVHLRSGRLLPFGWVRLLRNVKRAHGARILLLGVKPEHQTKAVGWLLYNELLERGAANNLQFVEGSWVLATNDPMNKAMESIGFRRAKTWRMYERTVVSA
jgi:GNAT superfamily N-acetyltransferase